jgi:hypothetical protein
VKPSRSSFCYLVLRSLVFSLSVFLLVYLPGDYLRHKAESLHKSGVLVNQQGLCEPICYHLFSRDLDHVKFVLLDAVNYPLVSDIDGAGSGRLVGVEDNCSCVG